ncbi:winged helix-turn-helix domain-containing protein [Variovorax sp. 278MFTsu5.1]
MMLATVQPASIEKLKSLVSGACVDLVVYSPRGQECWHAMCDMVDQVPILLAIEHASYARLLDSIGASFLRSPLVELVECSSFNIGDLRWRIYSLLARSSVNKPREATACVGKVTCNEIAWKNYQFAGASMVFWKGSEIHLPPRQYELAILMFANIGNLLERTWLISRLWPHKQGSRSLDVCVAQVRKKLGLDGRDGLWLETLYGRGYRLSSNLAAGKRQPPPHRA